jgi:poly-gamma-glutamate synthesis protein (capsule biosynthesis protein)
VGGIRFAFLAYTFDTGAGEVPHGREYLVNIIHADTLRADISTARAVADIVVVTPHMGFEYEMFVRQEIRDWAFLMVEAGADIVVAHHPHVVQEMGFVYILDGEETRRGFIAYSLGNFISSQREPPTEMGIMLNLYFERRGGRAVLADASYVLTWVKFTDFFGETDIQILPVAQALQEISEGSLRLRPSDIARLNEILLMEFL